MVNLPPELTLSGPETLAIAYSPRLIRKKFRWLLLFDRRLRGVVGRSGEPMIVQLRLAWWRNALEATVEDRPKGEPLLAMLKGLDGVEAAALAMVDAFEESLDAEDKSASLALFQSYARLANCDVGLAGKLAGWGDGHDAMPDVPRALRPLSILALAARLEQRPGRMNGLRLSWHALTGR